MCWFTCQPANFKGTSKYKNNHTLSNRNVCRNSPHATEYEVDSLLGGGFKHFLVSSLLGEMIQFD